MNVVRFVTIAMLLSLLNWASANGSVRVTNLLLQKSTSFTEFTIECDVDFEYSHQIIDATNDRPHRIVVDIKDALHRLPQYNFDELPGSSITKIRTSQFSVAPQEVVRVVLDVVGPLTYKVNRENSHLTLHIHTPDDANFEEWAVVHEPAVPIIASTDPKVKPMPPLPGNEENAPSIDKNDKQKEKLQLTSRPIDESKLLTHVAKPQEETNKIKGEKGVSKDPSLVAAIYSGSTDSQEKPNTTRTEDSSSSVTNPVPQEILRQVDSAVIPKGDTEEKGLPDNTGTQSKPPKHQKTTFPETRVIKKPKFAEADSVALVMEEPKSKSDAVRDKYLARNDQSEIKSTSADAKNADIETIGYSRETGPKTKIEKIREKYSRGIKFVQDDADERRLAMQRQDYTKQEVEPIVEAIGPYSEYVPQREIVMYTSNGRRDPFTPLIDEIASSPERAEFPNVEVLRLVGVLQDSNINRALFEDLNGYAYILQTGDRVKNGFVVEIAEDHVVFQIRQYGWNRTIALELEDE